MVRLPPILRGSLRSTRGPAGLGGFTLPCRKIVLEYNDHWPSSEGARDFARHGRLSKLAQAYPSVEMVLQEKPNKQPTLRGFFVNGREKGIPLLNKTVAEVAEKFQILLDSNGTKLVHLKHRTVVGGSPESARGMWSPVHGPRR